MEQVVEQVLFTVRKHIANPYTLDDLARMARFSKFHFARAFRRVTGISPRRFVYALRLQEAKRLLVTTTHSVADISHRVGYSSVGTFTTRFTTSVGVPPAVYRRLRGEVGALIRGGPPDPAHLGEIIGTFEHPVDGPARRPVVIGLFERPISEGRPARCAVTTVGGVWSVRHIPQGRWYVVAVAPALTSGDPAGSGRAMISVSGPVRLGPDNPTTETVIRLRHRRTIDPPILTPLATLVPRERRQPVAMTPMCWEAPAEALPTGLRAAM